MLMPVGRLRGPSVQSGVQRGVEMVISISHLAPFYLRCYTVHFSLIEGEKFPVRYDALNF